MDVIFVLNASVRLGPTMFVLNVFMLYPRSLFAWTPEVNFAKQTYTRAVPSKLRKIFTILPTQLSQMNVISARGVGLDVVFCVRGQG